MGRGYENAFIKSTNAEKPASSRAYYENEELYELTGENGAGFDEDFLQFVVPDIQDDFQSEIIIQGAKVSEHMDISKSPDAISDDNSIPAETSLAKKLLTQNK